MVWVRSPVYFYKRKDTFYFSRAVPSDLRQRFKKRKIEVSLRTKSQVKAARSAAALSDRLERYWDSLRMEMVYSRELGLSAAPEVKAAVVRHLSLPEALHFISGSREQIRQNCSLKAQNAVFDISLIALAMRA